MNYNCIYLEEEPIGGFSKQMIQYGYYCRKDNTYNDNIKCDGCEMNKINK